jgi:hypothetical protein
VTTVRTSNPGSLSGMPVTSILSLFLININKEWCLLGCYAVWLLSPWWKRRQVPPKLRILQEPHGVTSHKIPFFIVTAVKTSNLTTLINLWNNFRIWGTYSDDVYWGMFRDITPFDMSRTDGNVPIFKIVLKQTMLCYIKDSTSEIIGGNYSPLILSHSLGLIVSHVFRIKV